MVQKRLPPLSREGNLVKTIPYHLTNQPPKVTTSTRPLTIPGPRFLLRRHLEALRAGLRQRHHPAVPSTQRLIMLAVAQQHSNYLSSYPNQIISNAATGCFVVRFGHLPACELRKLCSGSVQRR